MHIEWTGEPIFYTRKDGCGLVTCGTHYMFDNKGKIERVEKLTQSIIDILIDDNPKYSNMAKAAFVRAVSGREKKHEPDATAAPAGSAPVERERVRDDSAGSTFK